LLEEHLPDTEEGVRQRSRFHVFRRLLEDPVVYYDELEGSIPHRASGRRRPPGPPPKPPRVAERFEVHPRSFVIALMEDQTAKLKAMGLRAKRVHSGRNRDQSRAACRAYLDGALDFLASRLTTYAAARPWRASALPARATPA
jgi:hypothetical protein